MIKKLRTPLILFLTFWIVAIVLWQTQNSIFYLFNFGYIGTAVGGGVALYTLLPKDKKPLGRRVTQLLVGIYMLCFLGFISKENMQLEGFFLYLLAGFFAGSVIHYLIAKIAGPLLFNRGFCGWACWTAMVLDLLPYKENRSGRLKSRWEHLRIVHFLLSLLAVIIAWTVYAYRPTPSGNSELFLLISGNIFYFLSAIILAIALKDNRAFCKYLCPVTVMLKAGSRFSLLKIEGEKSKCTACGACTRSCPMDIEVMKYVQGNERVLSTECILCLTCTTACPEEILSVSFKADLGGKDLLVRDVN